MAEAPHIAILPSPGMGHLIPLVAFAEHLVLHHNFSVTFIIPTDGSPVEAQKSVLHALLKPINSIFLPPVNFDDLPKDVRIETIIYLTVVRSLPSLRDTLKALTAMTRVVSLIVDIFSIDAMDIARELNILPYMFFSSNAMMLSFTDKLPELNDTISGEYKDHPKPFTFPGCVPLHGKYFLDPTQDKTNKAYEYILHSAKKSKTVDGILINTFIDLEPRSLKALMEGGARRPPIYPIGPLIRIPKPDQESECLKWLDDQPSGSVLFVSFGSGGTLSYEQVTEFALGLELSGQIFLWIAKSPHDQANATYFTAQSANDPYNFLPNGFTERTKGLGFVMSSWAPQIQILTHGSTGGFLTHCGWNSVLESLLNGVPLIAWPLYAEQKTNAVLLEEDLKIALRPKANEKGVVEKEEIGRIVKELMEGEEGKEVRNRMKVYKEAAEKTLTKDGSSMKSLSEVAFKWENHK